MTKPLAQRLREKAEKVAVAAKQAEPEDVAGNGSRPQSEKPNWDKGWTKYGKP